jgi:hypothetical protein
VDNDFSVDDFDDGSIMSGRVDDDNSLWKLLGGYRLNQYVSVEAGYVDLSNDVDNETTFAGISNGSGERFVSFPNSAVSVDIDDIKGPFMALVGHYPVLDQFLFTAKAGILFWQADEITRDLNGARKLNLDGTDALLGIGLQYEFANRISIRGEYENYLDVAGADHKVIGFSVLYFF